MSSKESNGNKSPHASSLSGSLSIHDFSKYSVPLSKNENLFELQDIALDENSIQELIEEKELERYQKQLTDKASGEFSLDDIIPVVMEGIENVVKDSFTECFTPKEVEKWNFNWVLFPLWCFGVFVRYCIILPCRIAALIGGTMTFVFVGACIYLTGANENWMRWALQWFGAIWLLSISAVVRYHGIPPVRRKNQIYVANHTSLIDFIVLSNYRIFSTVGQKHPGFIGFLQDRIIFPLRNIFFERFEVHDRTSVPSRIMDHIGNIDNPPLLIFPEGVCVNNEYCLMFKKGVFELEGIEIVPIAIKYNKLFSDPYWSSRDESFIQHIIRLMRGWCTVANVYFLEPQHRLPGENAVKFADRVKDMISKRAGLINLQWDGYLKYYTPSVRLLEQRQKQWADRLKENMAKRVIQKTKKVKDVKEVKEEVKGIHSSDQENSKITEKALDNNIPNGKPKENGVRQRK